MIFNTWTEPQKKYQRTPNFFRHFARPLYGFLSRRTDKPIPNDTDHRREKATRMHRAANGIARDGGTAQISRRSPCRALRHCSLARLASMRGGAKSSISEHQCNASLNLLAIMSLLEIVHWLAGQKRTLQEALHDTYKYIGTNDNRTPVRARTRLPCCNTNIGERITNNWDDPLKGLQPADSDSPHLLAAV